jgi:hypothetical protein
MTNSPLGVKETKNPSEEARGSGPKLLKPGIVEELIGNILIGLRI